MEMLNESRADAVDARVAPPNSTAAAAIVAILRLTGLRLLCMVFLLTDDNEDNIVSNVVQTARVDREFALQARAYNPLRAHAACNIRLRVDAFSNASLRESRARGLRNAMGRLEERSRPRPAAEAVAGQ